MVALIVMTHNSKIVVPYAESMGSIYMTCSTQAVGSFKRLQRRRRWLRPLASSFPSSDALYRAQSTSTENRDAGHSMPPALNERALLP